MWSVFTVMGYFLLALLLPVGWALGRTWRRAKVARHLTCPESGIPALVRLDPGFAVRMHARGEDELLVRDCTQWTETGRCGQTCLQRFGNAA
ncbi:MAG TPA: hypothetical protein VKU19_37055 [Bryobacteraceae bacterium]|nr:hypothetical protein [Bryobacteraceae bacterium]